MTDPAAALELRTSTSRSAPVRGPAVRFAAAPSPARSTRWSARTARASRPWSRSSPGCTGATRATFLLDGAEADFHSTADSKAAGIAVIYQEPTLFPDLSVTENIFMGRQPLRAGAGSTGRDARRGRPALPRPGRAHRPAPPGAGLSIADQQIIEIAKAISLDARLLIMDEPTAALSGVEVERLFAVARGAARRGPRAACSSPTASTRSSRSATRSPSCATARTSPPSAIADTERRPARGADGRPRGRRPVPEDRRRDRRARAGGRGPGLDGHVQRRQLHGPGRRDRRPGRPGRRRPQRDRPRRVRRRRLRRRRSVPVNGKPLPKRNPRAGDPRRAWPSSPRTGASRAWSWTPR